MAAFLIYLLVMAESISIWLGTMSRFSFILAGIFSLLAGICFVLRNAEKPYGMSEEKHKEIKDHIGGAIVNLWPYAKKIALIAFVCGALGAILPNNRQAMYILGGAYLVNSEQISQLPENAAYAVNSFLGQVHRAEDVHNLKGELREKLSKVDKDKVDGGTMKSINEMLANYDPEIIPNAVPEDLAETISRLKQLMKSVDEVAGNEPI